MRRGRKMWNKGVGEFVCISCLTQQAVIKKAAQVSEDTHGVSDIK